MSLVAGGKFKGTIRNHIYQRITPARLKPSKSKKSVKQRVKEEVIRHLGSGFIGSGVPLAQQMTRVKRAHRGPVRRSANQSRYNAFVKQFFAQNPLPAGSSQAAYQQRMRLAGRAWRDLR